MWPDAARCVVDEARVPTSRRAVRDRWRDPDVRRKIFWEESEDGGAGGVAEGTSFLPLPILPYLSETSVGPISDRDTPVS